MRRGVRRPPAPRGAALAVLLASLAACATLPPGAGTDPGRLWQQRSPQLQSLTEWGFDGRVAVSQGRRAWSARLSWRQRGEMIEIAVLSPLGQRLGSLEGGARGFVLERPGLAPATGASAERLLEAAFGWSAPVEGLRHWLLGLPHHGGVAGAGGVLDQRGRITRMVEDGWRIEITRYGAVGMLELPRKLTLRRPGLRVRLVIDDWRV